MMPRRIFIIFILLITILFSRSIVHALTIETTKGDIIKGEFGMEKLKVQLQLGGAVEVGVSEIIDISGDKMDNLTFKLRDGMVLKGKIGDEKVTVKTRFGDIPIPLSEIKSINLGTVKEDIKIPLRGRKPLRGLEGRP